jgi:PAS domain S-box-containing protein
MMAEAIRFPQLSTNGPLLLGMPPAEGDTSPNVAFLEAVKAAIIITDSAGIIMYWNSSAEELYGWQFREVLGRNILEITVSSDTKQEAQQHMAALNAGKSWSGEFEVRCKDEKCLAALVTLSPILDASGTLVSIVGVSQDLSRRKHADEILLRAGNQFYALASSLPELCWMADGDGSVFWYNEKWYEYTGTEPEEVEGWGWQSVHDPRLLPAVLERWQSSIRTSTPFEMEFPLRRADGVYRWFLTRVRPVRDPEGKTTRWFGTGTDIHEQRQLLQTLSETRDNLENRVQERTAELNRANKSLRELSACLLQLRDEEARRLARELHDSIGQMLAAISMNIAKVTSQVHKLDQEGARAVAENALLIEQISDEIRTISHLLHPPLLDEVGLASALRWFVDGFSERSKIKVEMEIPPDLGRLSTTMETAIFRMIQECLTNVHRHSGSKSAAIRILREDNQILIEAKDLGKGIPAEKLRRTSDGRSGVGFRGMAERIRYLGGNLKIHSDSNGTVVTATLPLEYANAPAATEGA